jgi:hypothetical protein
MLEICIQISYDQNVQLILKSWLPVVYGTTLRIDFNSRLFRGVPDIKYDICMQISSISVIKTTERKADMWLVNL